MNKIQKICLGLGLIWFVLVGLNSMIWQRSDGMDNIVKFPQLVAHWVMITVVTLGFMYALKSESRHLNSSLRTSLQTDENRNEPRSLRRGFRRLVFVFSLIPVIAGLTFIVMSIVGDNKDMFLVGILIAVLGFITVWLIHIAVLFVIEGFRTKTCACCGRGIHKLADSFIHKRDILCIDCYDVLGDKANWKKDRCSR